MECLGRDVTRDWRAWKIDGQVAALFEHELVGAPPLPQGGTPEGRAFSVEERGAARTRSHVPGQVAGMQKDWSPHLSLITVKARRARRPRLHTLRSAPSNPAPCAQGCGHTIPSYCPEAGYAFFANWLEAA